MTGLQALDSFNIESRVFQNTSEAEFKTTEIEYLLNKAQDIVFQMYYERFEQSEDKRFALDELITVAELDWATYQSTNQDGVKSNGRIWKMPSDFFYSVEESALDSSSNFIKVKPIGRDYYNLNIDNPLKNPNNSLAWRLDHKPYSGEDLKRRETISSSSVTISTYMITYIKRPAEIDITDSSTEIELGYKATKELITEAVKLAYSTEKDTVGYNLKTSETKND